MASDMDMMRLMDEFDTESECRNRLTILRWPNGVRCPGCDSNKIRNSYTRFQWDCGACGYQFSVTTGTIFHDTHLPLPKWFVAIYLMIESKKGISANQMKRTIGVSYKTAWYLCHRIRAAMYEANPTPLSGTVEVDETYVGGKVRGHGRGYRGNKATVLGAVEPGGKVRIEVAANADRKTLHAFIHSRTLPETENVYTDQHPRYVGIDDADTRNESVNHSIEEWVRGDVHTQTIESVWSLVKRSIIGSYHQVSVKHLDSYLDEVEWRQNNRENQYLFRDTLRKLLASRPLEFTELVSG